MLALQYNTIMKEIKWDEIKNAWLKETRDISFEEILEDIRNGNLIKKMNHPNQSKYPGQRIFIVEHNKYCYMIPFIENEREYFFKTIIPSRKATKRYVGDNDEQA